MATTYASSKCAAGVQPLAGIGTAWVYGKFEATVALVINDVIQMVKVPTGATVMELILSADDIDGGSAALLSVGDGGSTARYIATSSIGQAGGTVRLGGAGSVAAAPDAHQYVYTVDDTIDILVATAPASVGTGTLALQVAYTMQQ